MLIQYELNSVLHVKSIQCNFLEFRLSRCAVTDLVRDCSVEILSSVKCLIVRKLQCSSYPKRRC